MKPFFHDCRYFFVLWAGQTLSRLGSSMTAFALSIWAYQQQGTVTSVALLLACNYLPAAVTGLFAGTLADRFSKKAIMLCADTGAALMTVTVLLLYRQSQLRVEHLYLINAVLGVCGALQGPASDVAVSLLVPREHYLRVSGLQSFAWSLNDILSPVLATAALAFGGLGRVIAIDLGSFLFAFGSLLCLRIPQSHGGEQGEGFAAQWRAGLRYLRGEAGLRRLIAYQALLNLVAAVGYFSVLGPMVLARTGGDELALGWVNTCIGLGAMVGGLCLAARKPRCRKVPLMCWSYAISFLGCDLVLGLGRSVWVWCVAAFLGNLPLPYGDGALGTLYREHVPVTMQGRVFAVRNACIQLVVLLGYLLGAVLADHVAEPLVSAVPALRWLLGEGPGRAMGLVFLVTPALGAVASLAALRSPSVRALEAPAVDKPAPDVYNAAN